MTSILPVRSERWLFYDPPVVVGRRKPHGVIRCPYCAVEVPIDFSRFEERGKVCPGCRARHDASGVSERVRGSYEADYLARRGAGVPA